MKVLVTGTSSGIGFGLAQEFLARDNEVWGISRRTAPEMKNGNLYRHLELDLTDYASAEEKIPDFVRGTGRLDLVVLNAGILGPVRWMSELGLEGMKEVMEINVWANKVVLDLLLNQPGEVKQVVGISSKASLRSSPGWGPYSVSKAGLNMLMNVYAKETPRTHFCAFAPGLVDSEIQEEIWNNRETEKYPTIKKLQEARHTDAMPEATEAAPMLIDGMKKALEYESGTYLDVREM